MSFIQIVYLFIHWFIFSHDIANAYFCNLLELLYFLIINSYDSNVDQAGVKKLQMPYFYILKLRYDE